MIRVRPIEFVYPAGPPPQCDSEHDDHQSSELTMYLNLGGHGPAKAVPVCVPCAARIRAAYSESFHLTPHPAFDSNEAERSRALELITDVHHVMETFL